MSYFFVFRGSVLELAAITIENYKVKNFPSVLECADDWNKCAKQGQARPSKPACNAYKTLYNRISMKELYFEGASLNDLKAFPIDAKREAGFQLDRIQHGLAPVDWKPTKSIGTGVREIRIRCADGIYRGFTRLKLLIPFMCFTLFRKRRRKRHRKILNWRRSD